MGRQLDLNRMVLIGKTFREYHRMFSLRDFQDPEEEKILDAGSGVSSFSAEANASGWNVTASDEIYSMSADTIVEKCAKDLEEVMKKLEAVKDLYNWDYFKNIPELKENRALAYKAFVADYAKEGNKRYIFAQFPKTEFKDKQFTLSLVSHFLFLYEKQIPYDTHAEIIQELIRLTSGEIRIFPITNFEGRRSVYLEYLFEDDRFKGMKFEIKKTGYEFLKGANEILIIRKEG